MDSNKKGKAKQTPIKLKFYLSPFWDIYLLGHPIDIATQHHPELQTPLKYLGLPLWSAGGKSARTKDP